MVDIEWNKNVCCFVLDSQYFCVLYQLLHIYDENSSFLLKYC
jgi:hypothetical protein